MTAPPVFVVGAPRTGTTLMMEILNRHPRIHLFDEVHFFERIWDEREAIGDLKHPQRRTVAFSRLRRVVRESGRDRAVADVLSNEEFARRMHAEGGGYRGLMVALLKTGAEITGAEIWGDSSPQDVLYIEQILEWFPDARIIGVVRDPRGFLSSYKNYWRRQVKSYRERYNPLTMSVLWRSYMRALLDAKNGPLRNAIHLVHYEELVEDPERHVRAMCAHIGVDYAPAMIEVERSNTSFGGTEARGIFATSRDRWSQELTPTEVWVGERVFGTEMRELGYEPVHHRALPPSSTELAGILLRLPARLFRAIARTSKPVTLGKMKRVLSSFRRG